MVGACVYTSDSMAQFGGRGGFGGAKRGSEPARADRSPRQTPGDSAIRPQQEMIEELRQDLRLTPAQRTHWDSYTERLTALASDLERERARTRALGEFNAMQRVDQAVNNARNHLTALEEIAVAARALYSSLASEQQAIADQRLATIIPGVSEAVRPLAQDRLGRERN